MASRLRSIAKTIGVFPVVLATLVAMLVFLYWWLTLRMPGSSLSGPLPPPSPDELTLAKTLERHVQFLTNDIGERNSRRDENLEKTALWLENSLKDLSLTTHRQSFQVGSQVFHNIVLTFPSTSSSDIVVVGAHYDSAIGTVGANDNGSGVAVALELARRFRQLHPKRELQLVWFVNEEPPHFQTEDMGSRRYVRWLELEKRRVTAMLSLETLGMYTDAPDSQKTPPALSGFFPSTGNFLAFVGNHDSEAHVRQAIGTFRSTTPFPSEGLVASPNIPGIGWSDHWAFWKSGIPAIMVTDTAIFRDKHYHRPTDRPERLNYARLARVTRGLEKVIENLVGVN